MDSFITFVTVFDNLNDRYVDYLKEVYKQPELLKSKLKILFSDRINEKNIAQKHVFIKPNWVNHFRNSNDEISLTTNSNLIIATVEILLEYNPSKITIGDAPIQGCKWEKMCPEWFYESMGILEREHGIPINILDLRRVIFDTTYNRLSKEKNPLSEYVIFDVGKKSFLEPISSNTKKQFRVAHYDYARLAIVHHKGVHKYCITKYLFEADVVISMPKVKTHEKAGITAALKNLVGLNGDKDYLPHHRIGGTRQGGDGYPGYNFLRNVAEKLLDISNKKIGKPSHRYWQKLAIEMWNFSKPGKEDQLGAGWYGNDTTWRMVLDLNQIAIYGKKDGILSDVPQRQLFSLCDAIIGGQGNGPLFPTPLPMGLLSLTNNAGVNDYVYSLLMKFNPEKINLINNVFLLYEEDFESMYLNNKKTSIEDLQKLSLDTTPPPGWQDYLINQE